ncbi:MAG: hydroxymethylglutaryl-CoA lyase [Proteobacteria bacterium]|nr:hydroxymethylglutaryl-CoA lyase [Pseudomonadota bacterium]
MMFNNALATLPGSVTIREVSLRDGLQLIQQPVSTADKLAWVRSAYCAGIREMEVGAFVPPQSMPQLADTAEVLAFAKTLPGLTTQVLVPNLRGAERAIVEEADAMVLPLSASHAHSLANMRKTPDQVIAELGRIRAARDAAGARTRLEVGISTAFGCTIQGFVDPREVVRLVQCALDVGVERVGLADTVGHANPVSVAKLLEATMKVAGHRLNTVHFHDTRGLGLANCLVALQMGITQFDACVGGLGGCPHAPGASGNVVTEDLAYMFDSMGIATALDIDALLALRAQIAMHLPGETLYGSVWRTCRNSAAPSGTASTSATDSTPVPHQ